MTEEVSITRLLADKNWFARWDEYVTLISKSNNYRSVDAYIQETVQRSPNIDPGATIEEGVSLNGTVIVESGARLRTGTSVYGPAVIGTGSDVGPNSIIRGGVVLGRDVRIGPGAEIKSSIFLDEVKMYHYGYVGHSIVGRSANIAAGFISAVKRLDGKHVQFFDGRSRVDVGEKGGCIIGDRVAIAIGIETMPGQVIQPNETLSPSSVKELGVDAWSVLIGAWDQEANRFWMRNNVFLIVNTALIIFLARQDQIYAQDQIYIINMAASMLGVVLCHYWLRVNEVGIVYVRRWGEAITAIEKKWSLKPFAIIQGYTKREMSSRKLSASTRYMNLFIRFLRVFWVASLAFWATRGL